MYFGLTVLVADWKVVLGGDFPVVILVDFFFFSLPHSLPLVGLSLVTDV